MSDHHCLSNYSGADTVTSAGQGSLWSLFDTLDGLPQITLEVTQHLLTYGAPHLPYSLHPTTASILPQPNPTTAPPYHNFHPTTPSTLTQPPPYHSIHPTTASVLPQPHPNTASIIPQPPLSYSLHPTASTFPELTLPLPLPSHQLTLSPHLLT